MKRILLVLFLLPFLGLAQVMPAGDYVISSAYATDAYPNFKNLTTAVTYLNLHGIGGDVRFLLDNDQTTTTQITINAFSNANNNTVTIKPNAGKNIIINSNMQNASTGLPAVFLFNGARNVIIDGSNSIANTKNLTLVNTDNLSYTPRSVIWVASNGTTASTNITVKNSILKFSNRNQQITLLSGVYSGTNEIGGNNSINVQQSTASNSNIVIANNEMINVKDGIYINGSNTSSLSPADWKIEGNKIGSDVEAEKPIRGMYISNALNYEISGNTISGIKNTENQGNDAAGIILLGNSSGAISGNTINNIANTIYNNGTSTAGILIKSTGVANINNNIISNVYNTTADPNNYNYQNKGHGIFVTSGSAINIYYNTIVMQDSPSGTAYSSCLYTTGGSNINIKNNIFINSQPDRHYALFNNGGTIASISNNNYYATNSTNTFSNRNGSDEYIGTTGFSGWNIAVSDSNSQIILPAFVSTTDFHLQNVTANNSLSGVSISGITTDIDGENREKPYMGADEVAACTTTETPGNNYWKGYVYTYTETPAATTYAGSVAEKPNFDRNIDAGAITGDTSVEANDFCGTAPDDYFFVRYLMDVTLAEAGDYNITVGADDGYRLYIDNVLVNGLNDWGDHGYSSAFVKQTLSAGSHQFKLEYYENGGSARVSFSYGLPKGDANLPFGDNVWNVYGFAKSNLDFDNTELRDSYAGYYIDPNININSQTFWNKGQSPSVNNGAWNGAPIQADNFTLTYKRKGFPCGRYQIQLVDCDDVVQVYINGSLIFTQSYTFAGGIINNGTYYTLNKDSEIEIRLREDGGDANVAFDFIEIPFVYDGSAAPPAGSSITVNQDTSLTNNLEVCSCYIDAGKTLTVPADVILTVNENIVVNAEGKLVIKNNGSLLQDSNGTYSGAANSFIMERISSPMKNFDFSYWSSPVSGQTLLNLSPNTLSDKYMSYSGTGWK
ncbi:PA14 domain-containing protein, partial [Flavobacterium piscis]